MTLRSHNKIDELRFSPDGKVLVTADDTDSGPVINLWGVNQNWARLDQLKGYSIPVFSPDGRWLAARSGTLKNGFALWDLTNIDLESVELSKLVPRVLPTAHNVNILFLAFSPDGSMLVSTGVDGTVKVWSLSDQGAQPLMDLPGHTEYVFDASFSLDSVELATASQDGTVRIWDISPEGASEWFSFAGHENNIYRLALTQDGRYLVTASVDGAAKVWDVDTGKMVLAITGHGGPLFGIDISPDGSLIVTAGYDNVAKIWKLNLPEGSVAAEPLLSLTGHVTGAWVGGLFPGLTAAAFSPDGARLATGGVDGMAKIWDVRTGQELLSVQVHPDHHGVTSLAFSPDGRLLATTSDGPEPLAKIWDATNGTEISTFSGQSQAARIWGLAFSPDGERVATGSQLGFLKIWDTNTGQELLNLAGNTATVFGVDFSLDGKYLASVSVNGTATVWDAYSGEELQTYPNSGGPLFDVTFTPDGKRLIATGMGTVYGYILDQDELVHLAESRLTRWFTPAECRQFLHQEECPAQ